MSETQQESTEQAPQETEAEARPRRVEVETGELLPRWLTVTMYAVFVPFCLFAAIWITRSAIIQHNIQSYLDLLSGPWEGDPPPMESKVITDGRDLFEEKARSSLLFILQRMIIEEIEDPRMARAITLRKATNWGIESRRRELFEEILANMSEEGEMSPDYKIPSEDRTTLMNLIQERQERDIRSYEEQKITDVLEWLAQGRPTPPKGPEPRRVRALEKKYEKRLFIGEEQDILRELAEQWEDSNEPVKQSAAEKFQLMLEEKPTSLTQEEAQLCEAIAKEQEDRYMMGERRLSEIAVHLVKYIEKNNVFIDHPEVWEVIRLCQHRHESARQNMKDAVYALRNQKYCLIFLSEFLRKNQINPVMAVETVRLTKDEHEQILRRQNHTRRLACLDVAKRIALKYCDEPFPIDEVPEEEEKDFFQNRVIEPIEELVEANDEEVAARAEKVLDEIRDSCAEYIR